MADAQTQDQTNEANKHETGQTNDAPSPMPNMAPEAKAEPSGYRGNADSTSGPGRTTDASAPTDSTEERLNPSAPGNTGTTPGTNAKVG